MTKKSQRRNTAKELKVTGLSLPVRYRLAKHIVNGDSLDDAFRQIGHHAVDHNIHCECCGPIGSIYHVEGKRIRVGYGWPNAAPCF